MFESVLFFSYKQLDKLICTCVCCHHTDTFSWCKSHPWLHRLCFSSAVIYILYNLDIELLVYHPVLWHVFSHGGCTDVDGSAVNLGCNSYSGVPQTSVINEVCCIQGLVKLHFKITLELITLKLCLFSVLLHILVYLLLYWLEFQKCWAISFWLKCLWLSQKEIMFCLLDKVKAYWWHFMVVQL